MPVSGFVASVALPFAVLPACGFLLPASPFRRFKHWTHEGGIATPLVAHWPAAIRDRGGITSQTGHVIDIMATYLVVAGAKCPDEHQGNAVIPLEGRSLVPVLRGEERDPHDALIWEHEGNRAVLADRWELVSVHAGDRELYDLQADRTELQDLAGACPDKVSELVTVYDAWTERMGVVAWGELQS